MPVTAQTETPNISTTYEVGDYVSVARAGEYVLVKHYRTVHRDGGQVKREPVSSIEDLLETMIRAFGGQVYEVSGTVNGFFSDPVHARNCAEAIFDHHGKRAELSGTQLSVTL